MAQCFRWCSLVLLPEDRTRCEENGFSFLFGVTQEWHPFVHRPTGTMGGITWRAPWPVHPNFWTHHPNHLSAPKIRISWEFSGKQAQRCWENIAIFTHSGLGDGHAAEGLEGNNQKDYSAVRDNICGWQLQFLLLIRNSSLQERFLRDYNISQRFVTITEVLGFFLTISMEKVVCDGGKVKRKRLFQTNCFLKVEKYYVYLYSRESALWKRAQGDRFRHCFLSRDFCVARGSSTGESPHVML